MSIFTLSLHNLPKKTLAVFIAIIMFASTALCGASTISKNDAASKPSVAISSSTTKQTEVTTVQPTTIAVTTTVSTTIQLTTKKVVVCRNTSIKQQGSMENISILQSVNDALTINLRTELYVTGTELNTVLSKTKLRNLGTAFVREADEHNINVLFLLAVSVEESGWGSSYRAAHKNNIFGIESSRYFSTKEECIEIATKLFDTKYLTKGGSYYSGMTIRSVNKRYCPVSTSWSNRIASIMIGLTKTISNNRN